jgi:hypothetical protein
VPDALAAFQKIVATRNDALHKLQALERPLLARSTELATKRRNTPPLSAAEDAELADAESGLDQVHHSMWVIGQISLQAMNDSRLLRDLAASLNAASGDLAKTQARLQKIAKVADAAAEATAVLVELAEKVGAAMA